MHSKRKELINPVRVFFAILIVVIIWLAPVLIEPEQNAGIREDDLHSLITVPMVSADPPDVCSDDCKVWYCAHKIPGGGCTDWTFHCAGCEVTEQPPAVSHVLNCTLAGSNGWCMGNLSLDLSASDPQGSQVIISGDVNGTAFACPAGATTCSVPLPEGAGNANYKVDAATTGLAATGSATYLLDSSTPQLNGSVSGVVGTNGWYKSNVTLTVTASDAVSGIVSVIANVDGTNSNYQSPITFSDGVHTVTLSATDNAGHVTQTTQTFNIDTVTPVLNVSLSGSMGTNNWYISNVTVTPSANDSNSGLASLEATIDGGPWTVVNGPLSFTDGVHSYQFRATDNAGNITESGGTLNIDTTTPSLNLTTTGTTGLNGWYRSTAQITALGTDATSGVAKIEVSTDGGAYLPYTAPVTVNDGQHSYQFKVTDNAGNVTQSTKAVKVDTVTPSLSLNLSGTRGQNDWYVSSTSVTPTAADATSGIATLEMTVDGGPWTTANSPLSLADGLHTYQYRVMDNAGNVTETPVQNLKVDTIAPVIEMMDELKLGEYLYYDLEDPTMAGQENSGLSMYRAVIEDDDEKYQKIVWADGLEGDKARDSILWDGKFADGAQAGWGSYFITLKISDAAGNERMRSAIVKVGLLSFLEEIPTFTPPQSTTLPAQTTQAASAAVTEFGGTNSVATGETTSESTLEGGTNSGATSAEFSSISAGGTAVFHSDTDYVQSGFTEGNASTSTPNTNPGILWGAAAAALLGATLADWQRQREEEEARKRAEAAARAEEEGEDESRRKTPGQIAYEKMMKQKHIVGALLAEKKDPVYIPSQKLEAEETNWLNTFSPVYQYEKRKEEAKQKAELQAGLSAYYEGRKAGEEASTPQPSLLSSLWNTGTSALESMLSPITNASGGGLLVRGDGPPNPIKEWWDNLFKLPGEKLLANAEALGFTFSPEMEIYMIASIEVQRKSWDIGPVNDNTHSGLAQLSKNELNTPYKQGFNADGSECDGADCLGYGLGLPGADPKDKNTAVLGMDARIRQVLDKADNNDKIILTSTDKYIIVAMAQNGGGFDLNDIDRVMNPENGFIKDGKVDWETYFDNKQYYYNEKIDKASWLVSEDRQLLINNNRSGDKDYDTKFILQKFLEQTSKLEDKGYALPEDLDIERIKDLIARPIDVSKPGVGQ